ncbi:MAG: lysophospholipid acyltransferase family protein [Planctomycetota bacterium]|jgi:1-acyl-sn-glycerol-3-phosphate acyltransferase
MNIQPFKHPPRWWSPKLNSCCVFLWRLLRWHLRVKVQRLVEIEVRGLEHLSKAIGEGCGVLITPNHSGHADPLILYKVSDQVGCGFYFMAAWQVFSKLSPFRRMILRQHGCFSVDREGSDKRAFRQGVEILQKSSNPLVIFPEGEVYHLNDRVTPFNEGAAAIAMTASKDQSRCVVCVPCGIKYQYIEDPSDELVELMGRLEDRILWRVRDDLPLDQRIYRFAEGALSLKEVEYLGHTQKGSLPDRINLLCDEVLSGLEGRYNRSAKDLTLPKRVKVLRKEAINLQGQSDENSEQRDQARLDIEDLFFVTQLFSYPGDYVAGKATIERMAETLDKFEEDVLKLPTATIRGSRRAIVSFGEGIIVERGHDKRDAVHSLTEIFEQKVQLLLDEIKLGQL